MDARVKPAHDERFDAKQKRRPGLGGVSFQEA